MNAFGTFGQQETLLKREKIHCFRKSIPAPPIIHPAKFVSG